ncbi:MAG: Tryptophan 2,3-dioxygenase, partial [uncultured Frankineae bacterium]
AAGPARPGRDQGARLHPRAGAGVPARLRARARALGGLRGLRGARRPGGELPAVAVPARQDRRAHHRLQAGHRRLERGRVPAGRARADLLPRAVRRPHRDREPM